jgi:hypothetical protein
MWQSTVLALALLLLLVRPVRAQFLWSRRTQTNDPAATTATATHPSSTTTTTTTTTSGSRRSRGTEGDTARVVAVHRHHPVTSKTNLDEVEHPDRYYVEHHPYASGVFAFDPNLEINCMH